METGTQPIERGRRTARRSLTKPDTANPSSYAYPSAKVKPLEFPAEEIVVPQRKLSRFIVIGIVWGVISGIILLILHGENNLMYRVGNAVAPHCLIWGGIIGALYGLCLSPLYTKLHNALPAYAMLLFFPTILFLLTAPLLALNSALLAIGKFLLGLLGVGVVLFLVWAWISN